MSYVRFGEHGSAVYIYAHVDDYVTCSGCSLGADPKTRDLPTMLSHLSAHRAAGEHVPDWVGADMVGDWPYPRVEGL